MKYKVKDIIKQAVVLLDLDGRIACTDASDADTGLFVKLFNLVSVTLAERLPLAATETLTTTPEGDLFYGALAYPATRVLSVTGPSGAVRAIRLSDRLRTGLAATPVRVEYAYRPAAVELGDDSAFDSALLPVTVPVYALAAEYCLVMSMYDAAERWQARFEREFRQSVLPKGGRLPARSFL